MDDSPECATRAAHRHNNNHRRSYISARFLFPCILALIKISPSLLLFLPKSFTSFTSAFCVATARRVARRPILPHRFIGSLWMTSTTTSECGPNLLERLGLPTPVLLGSASFTRKLILKEMGIPFAKVVRPIDEKALGDRSQDPPDQLVLTLAQAKMDHLVKEIQAGRCQDDLPNDTTKKNGNTNNDDREWIVLTGDQVVTCNGQILEKPESIEEARRFVANYQTNPPSTVGSCVLMHLPSGIQVSGVDTATIYFQPTIPTDLVDRLVALEEPILSCAGGLMIEHPLTKEHLDRIDGTEDSVMGLSKDLVLRLLHELKDKLDERKQKSP